MRTILKSAVLAAGAVLVCAGGTATASPTSTVKATVPFPFVVNGQNFPAGTYTIQRDESTLLVRGEKGKTAAYVLATADSGRDPAGSQPALSFQRRENQYCLSSVWDADGDGWDVATK